MAVVITLERQDEDYVDSLLAVAWLTSRLALLAAKYAGQYVALVGTRFIAITPDRRISLRRVAAFDRNARPVVLRVPSAQEVALILRNFNGCVEVQVGDEPPFANHRIILHDPGDAPFASIVLDDKPVDPLERGIVPPRRACSNWHTFDGRSGTGPFGDRFLTPHSD